MLDNEGIGGRIAAERKLRGLTQRRLAERAHVSYSLLQKVERGERAATMPLVAGVATALGLERNTLTGQPYRTGDRRQDAIHDLVPAIRHELVAYRLPPLDDAPVPSTARLARMVARVSRARHSVDLTDLATRLPPTLNALRTAAHAATGTQREQVMGLLAEAYYAARQLLHKLGYNDLATLVCDRYTWAAEQSGDPLAVALSRMFVAGELDAAADWRSATAVMDRTVADVEESEDPATLSVLGFLHLMAGYMAAHGGDAAATWAHHDEARTIADRIGADRDDYRLAFGPTNVAIWGTSLGAELQDGAKAVALAERVHLPPGIPAERAGHHLMDLARGQVLNGDRTGALQSLVEARQIAPQQTRYHPLVRESLRAIAQAERRRSDTLRGLAAWVGLQDRPSRDAADDLTEIREIRTPAGGSRGERRHLS